MVSKESTLTPRLVRYRLATVLIWLGVLTWVPFIILRSAGYTPNIVWFIPVHLLGVVGVSRLKAAARRQMGAELPQKTRLRSLGHILILLGLSVWGVYFFLKLVIQATVEVSQFLPYHLIFMLSGVTILLVNFLVNRRKSRAA